MRYLLRRIGLYLVALWAALTINFFIPRLAPGNPAQVFLARLQGKGNITPQSLHAIELAFGISNQSLWQQYVQYLGQLLHGNLGISITYFPTPVSAIIAQDLPWTLVLVGTATIISVVIGTLLGVITAWKRGGVVDVLPPTFTFIAAIPYFWLALIAVFVFAFTLNWFPISGGYGNSVTPGLSLDFLGNAFYHAILPALTIVIGSISGWLLGMRNAMVTTLSEDYVLMAEAKGLTTRRVMFTYAARNALLPNLTGFALSLGFVVGGALVTEMVFNYPGIGFALFNAIENSDYALIQGIFLIIVAAVLVANFIADFLYTLLDPRVR